MIERVISGFQSGADIGGIRAAWSCDIPTGGWMPRGWLTEDGPRPEYAEMYGAREHSSEKYPPRTYANVRDSDATIWFGVGDSAGFRCTERATEQVKDGRRFMVITYGAITPRDVAEWIDGFGVKTLNVAGNRESKSPGIGRRVEKFLIRAFRIVGFDAREEK